MTLADLIKDFIDTSKERIKTPISGAFLWSFIIWNWRPIIELCFSKVSIEDRIYIINVEYCSIWSVLGPLVLAFLYTIAVPMIMEKIDRLLIKTKKARVDNIFESKEHTIDKKIELARKEFKLKNIESGNKQIEDFQREIKDLEDSKSSLINLHKLEKEELSESLHSTAEFYKNAEERNNELKSQIIHLQEDLKERRNESYLDSRIILTLIQLNPYEVDILRSLERNNFDDIENPNLSEVVNKFDFLGLINSNIEEGIVVSSFGLKVIETIGHMKL